MKLIDVDAIPWEVDGVGEIPVITKEEIDNMPTVEAVPVRHGKWIRKNIGDEYYDYCSECRYIEWNAPNNYCPNCGARMDEE